MFKKITLRTAAAFVITSSVFAQADKARVDVTDAWIRPTVAGQMGTGGFMKLTAHEDLRLVRISSPVAGSGGVHEVKMGANNVMEMRPITGLDLPKGQSIELKPGGYHVMLLELKSTLTKDSTIPLTLYFKAKKGQESKLDLQVPVSLQAMTGAASQSMPKH